jgi:nucleolar complex protein 2
MPKALDSRVGRRELMKSLVYPLVEVIMATARSCPSPVRHAPLRFHCVRLLQQLAAAAQIFIPTTPLLLDSMDWKEWTLNPKKSKKELTRGVDVATIVKFGKEDPLRSYEQLEACLTELLLLVNREIDLYRYSAGFPEFSIRITGRLRQFAKTVKNSRWKAYCRASIETAEKYAKFAIEERAKLKEAPKDVKVLECLKPPGESNMRERYEANVAKERKAMAGTAPSTEKESSRTKDAKTAPSNDKESVVAPNKKKRNKKSKNKKQESLSSVELLKAKTLDDRELKQTHDEVQVGVEWSDDDDDE